MTGGKEASYNSDTVVVDVSVLMELFLQFGVTVARSEKLVSLIDDSNRRRQDILDTTGVQSSTIHRSSHHIVQRSRMIIIVALLSKLLFEEIRVERTRFSRDTQGYMNVFSRHGSQRRPLEKRSAIV